MASPFESDDASYVVLRNDEHQHSLWPAHMDIPAGWNVVKPADSRKACLQFVEDTWTDMRPRSLAGSMDNI
ncbi:MAG: MbtH family NRPS accessory protein [Nocardiopsaceae bacterium]|nr:MbtH family NRPS accessory protein [Nocardiopsaceae bacterium]